MSSLEHLGICKFFCRWASRSSTVKERFERLKRLERFELGLLSEP
jgi:hypothetical protein